MFIIKILIFLLSKNFFTQENNFKCLEIEKNYYIDSYYFNHVEIEPAVATKPTNSFEQSLDIDFKEIETLLRQENPQFSAIFEKTRSICDLFTSYSFEFTATYVQKSLDIFINFFDKTDDVSFKETLATCILNTSYRYAYINYNENINFDQKLFSTFYKLLSDTKDTTLFNKTLSTLMVLDSEYASTIIGLSFFNVWGKIRVSKDQTGVPLFKREISAFKVPHKYAFQLIKALGIRRDSMAKNFLALIRDYAPYDVEHELRYLAADELGDIGDLDSDVYKIEQNFKEIRKELQIFANIINVS